MRTRLSVQHFGGRETRRRGFTLIELLAVLAIILVVVGLLSVALNQTKTRTMRVMCLDNMRQLQYAWTMYAADFNDHVALNQTAAPGAAAGTVMAAAMPRNSTNSWVAGNPKVDTTWQTLAQGTLYPYVKHPEVYRCPMDSSTTKAGNPRTRSYSIDAYLGGDDDGLDPRVKMRLSDIVNPGSDKVFVFIEEHEKSIWGGGFMVMPRDKFGVNTGSWSSTPSDRHMQGCNLTFVDGHLEYWKWSAPKKANLIDKLIVAPNELRDLRRLQESVPKP